MTLEEIRDLIKTVCDSGIAELEVQRGDNRVWIKRTGATLTQEIVVPAAAPSMANPPAPFAQITVPATAPSATDTASGVAGEADLTDPTLKAITAPIVGTYYESPAPGAECFVKVGDAIRPGKVLCIIESMKLMNEIEAEVAGVVESKLVINGQPVEYGEALFAVRSV